MVSSLTLDPASTQPTLVPAAKVHLHGNPGRTNTALQGGSSPQCLTLWGERGQGASDARILERTRHVIAIKKRGSGLERGFQRAGNAKGVKKGPAYNFRCTDH